MGKRGAGRRLNDQERMEILDILAREAKVKNVDLAKRYGVSEGAIRKLKQIKDTIRDRYIVGNEHNRDKRKRGGFVRNAKFEQELYEWICRMRESQAYQLIPLTQTAVRQQAMILAKKYESMATFKASPGWFARFCSRHRLDPPVQQADLQGSDPNDVTMAAVGDTVPGGPLASAYQVDPALTASAIASANAVFAEHLAAAAAASVKADGSDLNCGEAVVPLDGVPHVDLTEIPSTVSVEEAVAEASKTEPIAMEVKKHEIVVQQATTSEEEIFSLGL